MMNMRKKGQAEIMDGLILMLIAATCSVVLLSVASNYGTLPTKIYEETYTQKLAQNTLLSLYHITYLGSEEAPSYRKSIMVSVSRELSDGNSDLKGSSDEGVLYLRDILEKYHEELGWHFMFALTDQNVIVSDSVISTEPKVTSAETFKRYVGNPFCASAALTYPNKGGCVVGGEAGSMCYVIFNVCAWLT